MVKAKSLAVIMLFMIIFGAINIYLFANKEGKLSYTTMSGQFIKEIPKLPYNMNLSVIAFVTQWLILIIVIVISYSKFLKHKKEEHIRVSYEQVKERTAGRSKTDLDVLYDILKDKKVLTLSTIAKIFKIQKEKALEWAKILENYGLGQIEYPAFSEPEIRITEKDEEHEKEKEVEEKTGKPAEKKTKKTERKTKAHRIKKRKKAEFFTIFLFQKLISEQLLC